uniref:Uncharacterized protein n=1 Tax=Strombidium inclinatum TaxID=197538 RepID=A0A7S3MXJ1_9SPIT|mmetsp:Transcript_24708/g.38467  ORF Transcript_24708/g.38467 Transcript_24708/m.38467 type:complete len:101 (+) Transcript_24708:1535-1837(+)
MKNKLADDMGIMLEYTMLFSILHYPGGVLTVTDVKEGEDDFTDNINDGWTKMQKDNAQGSKGMPISVTVYAHNYEDEKALAVLDDLDKQINFRMAPPNLQ